MPESHDKGLYASNRDFSFRWHLICAAAIAAVLLVVYITAKKLIFG